MALKFWEIILNNTFVAGLKNQDDNVTPTTNSVIRQYAEMDSDDEHLEDIADNPISEQIVWNDVTGISLKKLI